MVKPPRTVPSRTGPFTTAGSIVAACMIAFFLLVGGLLMGMALPLMAQAQSYPTAGVVITEDDRLNLRDTPAADGAIVGKIEPQTAVQVLGISDDGAWYQVEVAGIGSGWVSAQWIRLGGATGSAALLPTPTPNSSTDDGGASPLPHLGIAARLARASATPTEAATVAPSATVASDSATAEAATTAATNEATSEATDRTTGETTVEPTTETTTETTTEPTEVPATATPAATFTAPTALIQPARINVRGGPGTAFPVVASANQGEALEITGVTPAGDWYRVNLIAGDSGWVFASLVQVGGPADAIATLSETDLPAAPTPEAVALSASAVSAPPIVAAPPPSGGGSFGYGVQAHMLGGEVGQSMDAVKDLGFNWIKQQINWAMGGGDAGAIINEAGARGINVLLSVVDAPGSLREPGYDASVGGPPADPGSYAAFVGSMAASYCGTALKAIEVWNEENLNYEWGNKPIDPAAYMELLKAAYTSIKNACPSMLVISGALTPTGGGPPVAMDDFAYLEGMYQNGLAQYSDGIGAHPSGYNVPPSVTWEGACAAIQQYGNSFNGACDSPHHSWSFRSTMEGYRNIMNVYGDSNKLIWPTEFGWAAGGAFDARYAYANDNSFDEQAAWTVEAYQMMRAWGWVGPAFLWNLNFRVVADKSEKAQWGIVGNDWSPLPVYSALKSMPK